MHSSFQKKLQNLNFPPTFLKVSELEKDKPYKVEKISALETIYGHRITADIQVDQEGVKRVILPQRFQEILSDIEDINSHISEGGEASIIYKGKLGNSGDVQLKFGKNE